MINNAIQSVISDPVAYKNIELNHKIKEIKKNKIISGLRTFIFVIFSRIFFVTLSIISLHSISIELKTDKLL
jgi:hypothetical protein